VRFVQNGLLRLTGKSCDAFLAQTANQQRRLLTTLVRRATWQNGTLNVQLLEPFDALLHSNNKRQPDNQC
jgi:hypothetical protein